MAPRVIPFDPLDPSSIAVAIAGMQKFRDDFMKTCDTVLESLSIQGVINARKEIDAMGAVYTGNLRSSLVAHKPTGASRVYEVQNNAYYAGFVEYGTGIVGAASPHPDPRSAWWLYDRKGHGEAGWDYWNPDDNKIYHTTGYRARPFMYNTKLYLETQAEPTTKLYFNGF